MFITKRIFAVPILVMAFNFIAAADGGTTGFQALRIAHAGGGLEKKTYTNSYQALDANIENGFRYFEIDFTFTSDDQLVCLHDWKSNFKRSFGFETEHRLSLEEFQKLAEENTKFTNCTLTGLAGWMVENPVALIVTDVKEDNLKALKRIHEVLPDADTRVIPQVYDPVNFEEIHAMGFEQIIWTLYRYSGSDYQVIHWLDEWPSKVAVTMPKEWATSALPKAVKSRGIPTYVHTVNNPEEMRKLLTEFGITEIYTDFLAPRD